MLLPFKWKLFGRHFALYYHFLWISNIEFDPFSCHFFSLWSLLGIKGLNTFALLSTGSLRLDEPVNPPSPARNNHIHGSLQLGQSKIVLTLFGNWNATDKSLKKYWHLSIYLPYPKAHPPEPNIALHGKKVVSNSPGFCHWASGFCF